MVRFHQLVIEPEHTIESKIYGPHFEMLAAEWVARYASQEAGLAAGQVGQTVLACREHRTSHEIDVLALARGTRRRLGLAAHATGK